jgi:hypothetical protein
MLGLLAFALVALAFVAPGLLSVALGLEKQAGPRPT